MDQTQIFIERAGLLLEQGRAAEAIKQLNLALQQEPENDEALALYCRCQYQQHNFEAGLKTIASAIALDPENDYYFYLQGYGLYRNDHNSLAKKSFEQSLEINPEFAEVYGLMAYIFNEEKDFENALKYADEGLSIDPENIVCLNARSVALNKTKQTDKAIQTMETALAQDPENEFTHSTVGWNYLEKGNHKKAAAHFREALRIDPNHDNAKTGLKESLKSIIMPYRLLLQYSFWLSNKAGQLRWIIPIGLYILVRVLSGVLKQNDSTKNFAIIIGGAYLLFVVTSWLINPLANFFLLFHKDGKYAVNSTEKYTAITVVSSLAAGMLLLIAAILLPASVYNLDAAFGIAILGCWGLCLPLSRLQYPLKFYGYGRENKFSLLLAALGIVTILLAFIHMPYASVTGTVFLVLLVISSWTGIFR